MLDGLQNVMQVRNSKSADKDYKASAVYLSKHSIEEDPRQRYGITNHARSYNQFAGPLYSPPKPHSRVYWVPSEGAEIPEAPTVREWPNGREIWQSSLPAIDTSRKRSTMDAWPMLALNHSEPTGHTTSSSPPRSAPTTRPKLLGRTDGPLWAPVVTTSSARADRRAYHNTVNEAPEATAGVLNHAGMILDSSNGTRILGPSDVNIYTGGLPSRNTEIANPTTVFVRPAESTSSTSVTTQLVRLEAFLKGAMVDLEANNEEVTVRKIRTEAMLRGAVTELRALKTTIAKLFAAT